MIATLPAARLPYLPIGELFAGTKSKPPLGSTTVFESVGIAVEDNAAAKLVYDATTR
jgi:ornithine cyclodeaminase/alanine dehydrogenase-like protein (mu-crystallin family)